MRDSGAGADDGTPGKFDVGGSGAATYRIPAAVPQGTPGMTAALELNYGNQDGNGIVSWPLAGLPSDRALSADLCAGRRTRRDHLRGHRRVLPGWPASHRNRPRLCA
jgi:hypothetical protein